MSHTLVEHGEGEAAPIANRRAGFHPAPQNYLQPGNTNDPMRVVEDAAPFLR
jgi:hypothetical protein